MPLVAHTENMYLFPCWLAFSSLLVQLAADVLFRRMPGRFA